MCIVQIIHVYNFIDFCILSIYLSISKAIEHSEINAFLSSAMWRYYCFKHKGPFSVLSHYQSAAVSERLYNLYTVWTYMECDVSSS